MANELISIRNNRNEVFGFADQVVFCGSFDISDLYVSGYVYTEEERAADEKWIEEISHKEKKPGVVMAAAEKIKEKNSHKKDNK